MARQTTFRRGTGNFFKANGAPGNRANRIGFDDDEDKRSLTNPALNEAYRTMAIREGGYGPPLPSIPSPALPFGSDHPEYEDSMTDFDLTLGSGKTGLDRTVDSVLEEVNWTGPESPSDVSASSTGVPSKMALTAADEFMLSPGEIDFSPTAMAAPPMGEKRVFEETTPAEGPRSFWDKIGGGIKGALTSPGVGDALIATGTRVMSEGFGGLGEGLREGVAELEVGRQEKKYKDTINDLGKYLSEEERQIAHAMPEGQGFTYLREKMEGAEGEAARARGLVETLGMSPEAAQIMAKDAAASDRAMAGGRQVEMIKDETGQSYLINTATGEKVGGPYGTAVENLDRERLALAQAQLDRNLNRDQLNPLYTQVVKDYADTKQDTNALYALTEAVNLVNAEDLTERLGPWEKTRTELGRLSGDPASSVTSYLDNVLTQMGIQNLSQFKGAISDRELATALAQSGSINDVKDMLNAVIARNMRSRIRTARDHNGRIDYLQSQGIDAAGQLGFKDEDLDFFDEMERRGSAASGRLNEILGEDRSYVGRTSDMVAR
jgi:hypothetical protein